MASTKTILRPLARCSTRQFHRSLNSQQQQRHFFPNPLTAFSSPQTTSPQILTASRTLPYPSAPIYSIIADVPAYSSFLPYCQCSSITKWSAPDRTWQRRWPSEGILTSGFGGFTESFASRVYCVPGKVVESVCGDAETSLRREEIAHHLEGSEAGRRIDRRGSSGLLSHLRSTWTIEPVGEDSTNVNLSVEFAFTNPFYAALSSGTAPKVAEFMVKAFEQRVRELLEGNPNIVNASLGELDGSRLKNK